MTRRKMNKKNTNSLTWRNKADAMWRDVIRQGCKCEITGIEGKPRQDGERVVGLEAHHLIEKGSPKWQDKFRHDLSNGICLTESIHSKYQTQIGPHGNAIARENFMQWLKVNRPGQWQWFQDNKDNKKFVQPNYEQTYYELKEIYEKGLI
jgi:hypothetical protein